MWKYQAGSVICLHTIVLNTKALSSTRLCHTLFIVCHKRSSFVYGCAVNKISDAVAIVKSWNGLERLLDDDI